MEIISIRLEPEDIAKIEIMKKIINDQWQNILGYDDEDYPTTSEIIRACIRKTYAWTKEELK